MKKAWFLSLALTLTLTLTACGNSDAALRQENEALRQQILALEAERDNLTKENKDLTEENAALDDTAPESGDDEANPIDRFFEGVDVGSSTAEMNAVADSWAGAWKSECRNVAKWLKGQLPLQEDQALVDAYIASAEEQSARMDIMAIYPIADLTLPQTGPERFQRQSPGRPLGRRPPASLERHLLSAALCGPGLCQRRGFRRVLSVSL